ncbi:unnamed protein product [Linum tenue]|uniref:Cytochrome P450 n=1 Tax=Linum tenue TaxID=586396 RepID=A0AAV0RNV1_9ROSI|nr:unnamed protein product [Linum tenue]
MDSFFLLLNCFLCFFFTVTILRFLKRNQTPAAKLPPGPARLPIIGNIHNLGLNPHKSLADLAKVHGPLMSLKLGQVTTIVASSPAVAKEILQKHDKFLSNRHVPLALQTLDLHKFSITMLPVEPRWRNLRRVCNSYIFTPQKLDSNQGLRRDKIVALVLLDLGLTYQDLFVAGTDTTATTLEWAMTELLHNPNALTKVKEELDQMIGKDHHLEESDISRLPYLQAVIKETYRLHPPLPLLLPHKAGADVEIDGFTVPKGAQVLVNLWAIGRDSMIWNDPNSFTPERFLGSDVDVRGNHFELITFGAGRRICPGMSLAHRMLHMMLGSLVHWFDWKLPDGVEPEQLDMKEKFGVTLQKAKPLLAIPTLR